MIRSRHGIETLLNLINLAYAGLTILPYTEAEFEKYKDYSVQETRFFLGREIQEEVFIADLLVLPQINNNSAVLRAWLASKGRLDFAA